MRDRADVSPRKNDRHDLIDAVAAQESRKVRFRRRRDRTVWLGLGMFGVIGWSIAAPTLIGIAVGLWFDHLWPGRFSWTLALLLAGVTLGCFSAWYWVSDERQAIDQESRNIH